MTNILLLNPKPHHKLHQQGPIPPHLHILHQKPEIAAQFNALEQQKKAVDAEILLPVAVEGVICIEEIFSSLYLFLLFAQCFFQSGV